MLDVDLDTSIYNVFCVFTAVAAGIFSGAILAAVGIYLKRCGAKKQPVPTLMQFIFFPDTPPACKSREFHQKCRLLNCWRLHINTGSDRIKFYVSQASKSIDIAVQVLTQHWIAEMLVEKALGTGLRVRIILDFENIRLCHGSEKVAKYLITKGIEVRSNAVTKGGKGKRGNGNFHHKFIIIDDRILLNGSLNLTNTAVWDNCELCLVTDDTVLVESFRFNFDNLWKTFSPLEV